MRLKNIKYFIPIICIVFFTGCSISKPSVYGNNYPLQNTSHFIENISLKIPDKYHFVEDNECFCRELWFVKDDYSSDISINKLNLENSNSLDDEDLLYQVAELSLQLIKKKLKGDFLFDGRYEWFDIGERKAIAFRYGNKDKYNGRNVITNVNGVLLESTALLHKDLHNQVLLSELFKAQNSNLENLTY
ncbi:MAG: hypothetical protein WC055_03895 [Melioribacteraceae bacterium]